MSANDTLTIVHAVFSSRLAGGERHCVDLAQAQAAMGHRVHIVGPSKSAVRAAVGPTVQYHGLALPVLRGPRFTRVARQLGALPEQAQAKVRDLLARTSRILTQRTKDKNKLYALHAPEVECISKGKARTPYEFGVKVSIATTLKEGLVVGMRSMPGNPYDGHTLEETLEQVAILAERKPTTAIVDKGYRGVEIEGVRILRSGQKRGITRTLKAMIHRRSAIESAIGHMKMDGRLGRNPLKGALGDALHAVMCGAGHNLRMILAKLRLLCARFRLALAALMAVFALPTDRAQLNGA